MKRFFLIVIVSVVITILSQPLAIVEANQPLNVAFVRENDLWIKVGQNQEKRVAEGERIRNPKWSYDGSWLAFNKEKEETELWVYELETGELTNIHSNSGVFQWSPIDHKLAFLTHGVLNMVDMDEKEKMRNITKGVGNFSWQPNGQGFLISAMANLMPTGWTGVELFTVPVDANLDPKKIKHLLTLPEESEKFFAVTTSSFKWSDDEKWISFIGIPTASISMDLNTLCVMSADGKVFQQLGKMLYFDDWFQWAPHSNRLAFIEGEGRFAVKNKHLMVNEFPVHQGMSFTPEGFVEKGFTWIDGVQIVVSRAKESDWTNEPKDRPKPNLQHVNLLTHQQVEVTEPKINAGDYLPVYLDKSNKLAWVHADESYYGNIYIGDLDGRNQEVYIQHIGDGNLYEDSHGWSQLVDFFQ